MALLIAVLVAAVLMLALLVAGAVAVARRQRRDAERARRGVDAAVAVIRDTNGEAHAALAGLSDVAVADYAHDPELAFRVQSVFRGVQERLDTEARTDDALRERIRRLIDVLGRRLDAPPLPATDPVQSLRNLRELGYERRLFDAERYERLGYVIQMARDGQRHNVRDCEYAIREADDALDELEGR
jgi:hypothetical protein